MTTRTRRVLWWLSLVLAALALVGVAAFVTWGLTPLGPSDVALAALRSGGGVTVSQAAGGWVFAPTSVEPTNGFVLYPGGHVDARSYAPLAREIAGRGYLVALPKMPLSLAFFDPNAADKAIAAFPQVTTWSVGGHSLGGVAAAGYAAKHPNRAAGLVLFASYPADNVDLATSSIAIASTTGTRDGVVNRSSLAKSYSRLPPDADTAPILGGNHAQFGSYGPQPGDNPATISAPEQWRLAADATQRVLEKAAHP
jgi:hypothetical protein